MPAAPAEHRAPPAAAPAATGGATAPRAPAAGCADAPTAPRAADAAARERWLARADAWLPTLLIAAVLCFVAFVAGGGLNLAT